MRQRKRRSYAIMARWGYCFWWQVTTKDWSRLEQIEARIQAWRASVADITATLEGSP